MLHACKKNAKAINRHGRLIVLSTCHAPLIPTESQRFPSPYVKFVSRPFLVYWKSPRNMLILSAGVFPKLFLTPTQFYLSTHKPLSPKASHPNPPIPSHSPLLAQHSPLLPWAFQGWSNANSTLWQLGRDTERALRDTTKNTTPSHALKYRIKLKRERRWDKVIIWDKNISSGMGVVLSIDDRTHSQADKILRNIDCEKTIITWGRNI